VSTPQSRRSSVTPYRRAGSPRNCLAGSIAGTAVSSSTAAQEPRQFAGFSLIFVPALYAMITGGRTP
jgi:hypothetical protein